MKLISIKPNRINNNTKVIRNTKKTKELRVVYKSSSHKNCVIFIREKKNLETILLFIEEDVRVRNQMLHILMLYNFNFWNSINLVCLLILCGAWFSHVQIIEKIGSVSFLVEDAWCPYIHTLNQNTSFTW